MASTHTTTNTPADPILRFLQALDDNDATMLRSAFTSDVILDQSGLSAVTGAPMPTLTGIDAVEQSVLLHGPGATMDTGHTASNFRVWSQEDKNSGEEGVMMVQCYVVGTHYRLGEGMQPDKSSFTAQSRWTVEVVQDKDGQGGSGQWKIRKAGMKVLWISGDFGVMIPVTARG